MIREALVTDIPAMTVIRNSVRENVLQTPGLVTREDYIRYLTECGKGWVAEVNGELAGFSIVGLVQRNVWALFVHPDQEGKGLGRQLHGALLDWYFRQAAHPIWLTTAPGTRAERFYSRAGWQNLGLDAQGEVRFEMTVAAYQANASPSANPDFTFPLITSRLHLSPVTPADAPFLLELLNTPGWLRYIGDRQVRTVAAAQAYAISSPLQRHSDRGLGGFVCRLQHNGLPIGLCTLLQRDTLPAPDIGFAFLPEYAGQGYAAEGAGALLQYAREVLGIRRLLAITLPHNLSSISLLRKLGLQEERSQVQPETGEELLVFGCGSEKAGERA